MALEQGTRFGAHEIFESIGAGGMAVVHRATDTKLEREAELLASLKHANIAQLYGLDEGDGTTALILELRSPPSACCETLSNVDHGGDIREDPRTKRIS